MADEAQAADCEYYFQRILLGVLQHQNQLRSAHGRFPNGKHNPYLRNLSSTSLLQLTYCVLGSTDSNDAVQISLVSSAVGGGQKPLHTFHPKLTYSIFGDEERIFGYQGLKINLRYNASDMRPGLQITYNKKFKTVGETSPTDLKAILENYLPKSNYKPCIASSTIANNISQLLLKRRMYSMPQLQRAHLMTGSHPGSL